MSGQLVTVSVVSTVIVIVFDTAGQVDIYLVTVMTVSDGGVYDGDSPSPAGVPAPLLQLGDEAEAEGPSGANAVGTEDSDGCGAAELASTAVGKAVVVVNAGPGDASDE